MLWVTGRVIHKLIPCSGKLFDFLWGYGWEGTHAAINPLKDD